MNLRIFFAITTIIFFLVCNVSSHNIYSCENRNISGQKQRVIVSTDIGGTDPDDFQSMVHLLLYADTLEIEGLISSPYGFGRKETILKVIDYYEKDYPNLKTYSNYPVPNILRGVTKQGATESQSITGFDKPTEGSEWIIKCARKNDPRPLNLLIWGGIEDLAQALHDAPDILPKLRVYFIGGPNKKWSVYAYNYIATNFKNLWIIESNDTYRGWFNGGNQNEEWSNNGFVVSHNVTDCGALGAFFCTQLNGVIKMGDTPSVVRLLYGTPDDPSKPSWGGSYVRAWERSHKVFSRITTEKDSLEKFGVLVLRLSADLKKNDKLTAFMQIENQKIKGLVKENGTIEFLFSPKAAKIYQYTFKSNLKEIDGKQGSITSYNPPASNILTSAPDLPNWWTDNPSPDVAEGDYMGAKTISMWRVDFLKDFAERFLRCKVSNKIVE